jgi:hypothetical protein
MLNQPERVADATGSQFSWRVGVYGGAGLGGVIWGLIALLTIVAPGDQTQHNAAVGAQLLLAAAGSGALGVSGVLLAWFGRGRPLRSLALALIVGSLSGWLIVASLGVQHYMLGWV